MLANRVNTVGPLGRECLAGLTGPHREDGEGEEEGKEEEEDP